MCIITPVGTPGLGYPFLLCLGKGLVVILGYVQTVGPLRSGVLFLSTTAPDLSHNWERSGKHRVSQERRALSPNSRGSGPPAKSRTPAEVPDHLYSNRTPRKGTKSTPCLGVVRSRHVSTSTDTCTRPLGLHTKPHPPQHSLW